MLRCRCSTGAFPEAETRTDEQPDARGRPSFVVGICGTGPKTRAFVTERTWAYQTKSAFSDIAMIARWRTGRNGDACGRKVLDLGRFARGSGTRSPPVRLGLGGPAHSTATDVDGAATDRFRPRPGRHPTLACGYKPAAEATRTSISAACRTSATATCSSSAWAWSMLPGPNTTVGMPPGWTILVASEP